MRTCPNCGGPVTSAKEDSFAYTSVGLDNVVLDGITVHRCAQCGTYAPSIPNIRGLHRTLVRQLVSIPRRLTMQERAFLETFVEGTGTPAIYQSLVPVSRLYGKVGRFFVRHEGMSGFILRALALFAISLEENKEFEAESGIKFDWKKFTLRLSLPMGPPEHIPETRLKLSNGTRPAHWLPGAPAS